MDSQPLVSIIIPCYNREKYISTAIDSCLSQTYSNIEIIVVDDGSSDNSIDVIKGYGNKVNLIVKQNGGAASARNEGIRNCSGDFIVFLDSDDWLSHDLIENHIKTFQQWPEIEIACSDSMFVDENGHESEINKSNWPESPSTPLELFFLVAPPFPACEMYRAATVKHYGGHDEDLKAFEETGLRLRIIVDGGKVVRTSGGYAAYRRVENSLTRDRKKLHACGNQLIAKLLSEFSQYPEVQKLLIERQKRHRLNHWHAILTYHFSLNPISIAKFCWHLLQITMVDAGYPLFLLREKPWKLS